MTRSYDDDHTLTINGHWDDQCSWPVNSVITISKCSPVRYFEIVCLQICGKKIVLSIPLSAQFSATIGDMLFNKGMMMKEFEDLLGALVIFLIPLAIMFISDFFG